MLGHTATEQFSDMDSAPCHRDLYNRPPEDCVKKQDLVDWFGANGCLADFSRRKTVMYCLI